MATTSPAPREPSHRRISRAPVVVTIGALGLALILVLLGARMAAAPGRMPDLSQPGTDDAPRQVNVILRDYVFNPRTLYLAPGETVRFNLINGGLVAHEFVLGDLAQQQAWAEAHAEASPPAPFTTPPPATVPASTGGLRVLLGSGESESVLYQVPTDSRLELMCHLPGHVARGMVGEVILVDP